ncbi:NADPH:quinone oxidoreductase [Sphingomonas sp. EC-HK361]|uniref:NADPH:quinone oxidoreductase family protein n=1 Tax=Sphingomonas sp. EC-HK361 TaxID=2038397 RepID=UPI001257259D|nr:NADPH:quinone oxidoreductase family protein [Sphingomonas sp. EC-HK361]VVT03674.1 NADPH:quinone oxidoreductase [Sphingomonas sp. EC-HK361]
MRALLSKAPGGPETLTIDEMPDPVAGAGEVVVAVKACAINYPDVLVIEDKYQFRPQRPFAPGGEISGVVESVGEGVTEFAPGDRVMCNTSMNGLSERVVVREAALYRLPDGRTFEEGASLLLTYGTTIHALIDRGHLKEGDTLLVLGAAGGVGLAAIELGKAFGARVVAAVSSDEKAAAAREAGADETIVYARAPFDKDQSKALAEQFKAAAGKEGYQVIYDPVGGDYAEPALRSIGWEGRYLVVGFPAGIPKLPLNLTLLKSCDVCGVFWGAFAARDPEGNRAHIDHLFRLWADGKIAPRVTEVFPFNRGGDAIAKMAARGAIGKLVVRVAD